MGPSMIKRSGSLYLQLTKDEDQQDVIKVLTPVKRKRKNNQEIKKEEGGESGEVVLS